MDALEAFICHHRANLRRYALFEITLSPLSGIVYSSRRGCLRSEKQLDTGRKFFAYLLPILDGSCLWTQIAWTVHVIGKLFISVSNITTVDDCNFMGKTQWWKNLTKTTLMCCWNVTILMWASLTLVVEIAYGNGTHRLLIEIIIM